MFCKRKLWGNVRVSGKILTAAQKQRLGAQYLRNYAQMKKKYAADWGYAVLAYETDARFAGSQPLLTAFLAGGARNLAQVFGTP